MPPAEQLRLRVVAHVLRRELGAHRRSFVRWLVPMAALLLVAVALQPSMAGNGGLLAAKLAALPAALRRGLGIGAVDLTRPAGYLAPYFVYVSLTAALLGASLGATVVAEEEARRTGEMLFTQPVARARILLGKACAALLYAVAYDVLLAAVTIAGFAAVVRGPTDAGLVVGMFAGAAGLGVCFVGLGMLVAALVRDARGAVQAGMGLVLAAYLVGALAAIVPKAHPLAYLSPFRAAIPSDVILRGHPDPLALAVLVAVGVVAAAAAIGFYDRKDLHA